MLSLKGGAVLDIYHLDIPAVLLCFPFPHHDN